MRGGKFCSWLGTRRLFGIGVVTALFIMTAEFCRADPLVMDNQFTLNSLHLGAYGHSAVGISESSWEVDTTFAWTNSFVLKDEYVVDVEQRELELTVRHALDKRSMLEIVTPLLWRGGGMWDHAISTWHEFFNLPNGNREKVEDDQYQIEGYTLEGREFTLERSGVSLGNVRVGFHYILTGEDKAEPISLEGLSSSLFLVASLPTAELEFGHSGIDVSAAWLTSWRAGNWEADAGLWGIWFSRPDVGALEYRAVHPELTASVSYQMFDGIEAVLGVLGGVQPLENLAGISDGFLYLDVGLEVKVSDTGSFTVLIRENPYPSRASADVSLILGYELGL